MGDSFHEVVLNSRGIQLYITVLIIAIWSNMIYVTRIVPDMQKVYFSVRLN